MELRKVRTQAPVTVRACHLRFAGDGGADQRRRRAHQLRPTDADGVFRLDGETQFKAGEVFETDFQFPKAMLAKIEIEDAKPKRKSAA